MHATRSPFKQPIASGPAWLPLGLGPRLGLGLGLGLVLALGLVPVLPLVLVAASAAVAGAAPATEPPPAAAGTGFAVVELFTAESSRSCVRADSLLAELTAAAAHSGQRVYTLAYHVDYWNSRGWVDPFSLRLASDRQREYVAALESRLFTPQMIVNGAAPFPGNDREQAARRVAAALAATPGAALAIETEGVSGDSLVVRYTLAAPHPGMLLQIVAVAPRCESKVEGGENAGRTLRHVNVVRALVSVPLGAATGGEAALRLPAGEFGAAGEGEEAEEAEQEEEAAAAVVVAFLQDPASQRVLGAALSR